MQPGQAVPRPDSYYHYELRGVVVHSGTAFAGHYYSYIKVRWVKWSGDEGVGVCVGWGIHSGTPVVGHYSSYMKVT